MKVASLHIHPVKSLRAIDLEEATVERRGLAHDRRWMVVNGDGKFLTQRSHPQLATISVTLTPGGLHCSCDGHGSIDVTRPNESSRKQVVVWSSDVDAAIADDAASLWLSKIVGQEAHFVFMDDRASRMKISDWTSNPEPVSFADAFPVLVTNAASLDALNENIEAHGGVPITIGRFRPNIVIAGAEPWAEDRWRKIKIGELIFDLVKPSDRCVVTTTDQKTGQRMGKEPLAALARIHRSPDPRINGVIFGENAVPRNEGRIRVGDAIEVLEQREQAGIA